MKQVVEKYVAPDIEKQMGVKFKSFQEQNGEYKYFLQPIKNIHFNTDVAASIEPGSDIKYIYIFSFIAIAILLIACINFTNLYTAKYSHRVKEIGIRKTLGSTRKQLIKQFLSESFLLTTVALALSILIIELTMPIFNNLVEKKLNLINFFNIYSIPYIIIFLAAVSFTAGGYPAIFLSRYDPVKIFRKTSGEKNKRPYLRNALVICQFTISIMLIIGTVIIFKQVNFIKNKKLGFNKDQIVVIRNTDELGNSIDSFKREIIQYKGISDASVSGAIFGKSLDANPYEIVGSNNYHLVNVIYSDYSFQNVYKFDIKYGRYYSKNFGSDDAAIVLNESAVKELGILGDPIGQHITYMHGKNDNFISYKIIGVIKDFNYESLQQKIKPLIIKLDLKNQFGKYISVRLAGGNIDDKIDNLKNIWNKFTGNQAFEYSFFDEEFAKLYKAENRTIVIVTCFSVLAIFIACLGLFGLTAYITEMRTKEVGIRKVLGANDLEIVSLLSKDFLKLVLIANIIAWPLAYFIMNNWLKDFAYRTNINIWIFVLSGFIALLIALLTVSSHSIKAANANPIKSLRYE